MVPLTFQVPAALLLVAGGALACFAGYRFFRVVLSLFGGVVGALLATTIVGAGSTSSLVFWAIIGGLAGALILNLAYFFGVVLLGAAIGASLATLAWARMGGEPHIVAVILFSVAGAVAAMLLQRFVIVVGTAFGGAWTLLVGGLALAGDRAAQAAAAASSVWVIYPLDPAPDRPWVPIAWLLLGVAGMVAQLRTNGGKVKKVSKRR
jgi:Domain of unknown function (DUF4203)